MTHVIKNKVLGQLVLVALMAFAPSVHSAQKEHRITEKQFAAQIDMTPGVIPGPQAQPGIQADAQAQQEGQAQQEPQVQQGAHEDHNPPAAEAH